MWTPVCMEPTLKYHPLMFDVLTLTRDPGCGQCLVGSLTGAVSSLLFGLFKCIAASYASIDINGDGVFMLAEIGISAHLYRSGSY